MSSHETKSNILKIRNAPVLREVTKNTVDKRGLRDLEKLVLQSEWNRQLNAFNPLMPL